MIRRNNSLKKTIQPFLDIENKFNEIRELHELAAQEGDASMLDKTMVIYGSPMGDSNVHNHKRCPLVLLGGANGQLEGNLHLRAAPETPMANVMLSVMHKLGMDDVESFGDSTGAFSLSSGGLGG